jgi:hypothetical protein
MRTFINLPRTSVSRLSLFLVGSIGLQSPCFQAVKSYTPAKAFKDFSEGLGNSIDPCNFSSNLVP